MKMKLFNKWRCSICFGLLALLFLIYHLNSFSSLRLEKIMMINNSRQGGEEEEESLMVNVSSMVPRLDIAVMVLIEEQSNLSEYEYAIASLRCYTTMHRYPLIVVRDSIEWRSKCPTKDFMFRRHCIVAQLLVDHDWTLMLDADIGVVNPRHRIEEWIDDTYPLTFYDRFFNWEIAAGSYIARNSTFAYQFLTDWSRYEDKLPNSFHGTDNGALQMLITEKMLNPIPMEKIRDCRRLWEMSTSFTDLFYYEACIRQILRDQRQWPSKLRIVEKGRAWIRDGWLTENRWAMGDFMFHGWQNKRLTLHRSNEFANWQSPFWHSHFDQCSMDKALWPWRRKMMVDQGVIDVELESKRQQISMEQQKYTAQIGIRLMKTTT